MAIYGVFAMILVIIYIFILLISVAAAVLTIIGQWKIFAKAGRHGWAALIPFYNSYVLYDMGNLPVALISVNISVFALALIQSFISVLMIVAKVNIAVPLILSSLCTCGGIACFVLELLANMNIAKKFGKSAGYGVGMTFLPFIFCMILGCDKNAQYNENI